MVESAIVLTFEQLWMAIQSFPQDIIRGWALGKTPKQIAEDTERPIEIVYQVLKKIQQAITDGKQNNL